MTPDHVSGDGPSAKPATERKPAAALDEPSEKRPPGGETAEPKTGESTNPLKDNDPSEGGADLIARKRRSGKKNWKTTPQAIIARLKIDRLSEN